MPSRGKGVRDFLVENQLRRQLSPFYVHKGVGMAENYFLHQVPSANAVLIATPDLGEPHWAQAFHNVLRAKNYILRQLQVITAFVSGQGLLRHPGLPRQGPAGLRFGGQGTGAR